MASPIWPSRSYEFEAQLSVLVDFLKIVLRLAGLDISAPRLKRALQPVILAAILVCPGAIYVAIQDIGHDEQCKWAPTFAEVENQGVGAPVRVEHLTDGGCTITRAPNRVDHRHN